jgi:methylated-DNA-[protein]-cysteine S-methyltransferase
MTEMTFALERVPTEIGTMLVLTDERQRLRALDWEDRQTRMRQLLRAQYRGTRVRIVDATRSSAPRLALERYFGGELRAIERVSTEARGTAFQQRVWAALRRIPIGRTVSYGALAERLGCPGAARAVGAANGRNPIGIVVPCHRVIGRDGSLTGYGAGIERKRWLLEHEGAL